MCAHAARLVWSLCAVCVLLTLPQQLICSRLVSASWRLDRLLVCSNGLIQGIVTGQHCLPAMATKDLAVLCEY